MELLAYIKELLLLNDCVIIPGFGGFVTNYKQAGLHASQFTPPAKSVSFNKKLNFNDGLLVNHVASEEGLNYIAARKKVDLMVQELNYRLTDGEDINIPGLGDLHYDEQQHLVFTPKIEGNLNIDAFGLDAFSYESLFSRQVARKAISQQDRQVVEVIFQKRSLKKVLLAVPLLFALAVIPLKNNTTHIQKSDLGSIREMMMPTATPAVAEETPAAEETITADAEEVAEAAQAEEMIEETPARYFLIVGSFRAEENAQTFIGQLDKKGYQGTDLGVIKGLHYISLGAYVTIDDALSARTNWEKQTGSGSWIYKKLN
ncbi:HU domain-containing protein [Mangrovibacterium diazotrophicum]|uniref:Sporulation related protein n=1 Tax=Mangrovibacterium diazotrophicum TaxID=1261403 RepID=A0A419WAB1_9BACT|nr:SPOR domain-containing protein [Mangrovibacterium diazotrophicum]RKD92342.1 sporulation related protein [Mangrovibacterium diazotrophicum]